MPCFVQADPAFTGVAEWAGISERDRTATIPTIPLFMDRRIVGFQERLDKEREDLSNSDQIGYIGCGFQTA